MLLKFLNYLYITFFNVNEKIIIIVYSKMNEISAY